MPTRLKWKTDLEKGVVIANFDRRGWLRTSAGDGETDWNLYWASVGTVKQIFNPDLGTSHSSFFFPSIIVCKLYFII